MSTVAAPHSGLGDATDWKVNSGMYSTVTVCCWWGLAETCRHCNPFEAEQKATMLMYCCGVHCLSRRCIGLRKQPRFCGIQCQPESSVIMCRSKVSFLTHPVFTHPWVVQLKTGLWTKVWRAGSRGDTLDFRILSFILVSLHFAQ